MDRQSATRHVQSNTPALLRAVGALFSFETLFILFLLAGRFKADPRFAWVPVDLTLLFVALSLLCAVLLFILGKVKLTGAVFWGIIIYLAFSAWIAFTLIWAPTNPYAIDKVLRISTLVFWAYAAPALIIAAQPQRVLRFYALWVLAAVWLALQTWFTYLGTDSPQPQLQTIMGGNYLGVGRVLGIAIVILIPRLFMESKREFLVKFFFAFLLVGLLITLLILGGRGPFIATILCLLLAFLFVRGHVMTSTLRLVFAFLLLAAVVSIASSLLLFTTLYRLQFLMEIPEWDVSAQGRLERIQGACHQITRAPIWGQGVGSFYYYHGDLALTRDYPHNIILELAAETGMIGLVLFFILVFHALRQIRWAAISNHPVQLVAVLILVHALLNAMVSGDLPDNRFVFVALGLLTGFSTNSPAAEGVRR